MEVKKVLMKRVKYNPISHTPLSDFCKETTRSLFIVCIQRHDMRLQVQSY